MSRMSNTTVAFVFGILGAFFSAYIFIMSRGDPGLRMAALVAATGSSATLLAIASTLLTGKDVSQKPDLPPGSTQITQVPPTNTQVTTSPSPAPPSPQEHP